MNRLSLAFFAAALLLVAVAVAALAVRVGDARFGPAPAAADRVAPAGAAPGTAARL